jgi:hypothetical protein
VTSFYSFEVTLLLLFLWSDFNSTLLKSLCFSYSSKVTSFTYFEVTLLLLFLWSDFILLFWSHFASPIPLKWLHSTLLKSLCFSYSSEVTSFYSLEVTLLLLLLRSDFILLFWSHIASPITTKWLHSPLLKSLCLSYSSEVTSFYSFEVTLLLQLLQSDFTSYVCG